MAVFQHSKPSSEGKCHSRLRFMPTRRLLSAVWHLVLYSYTMMVDGASVTDHLNVYTVRDISNVSNILTKNHYPFTYMETDGGHIWRNWRIYLGEFAQKIFK